MSKTCRRCDPAADAGLPTKEIRRVQWSESRFRSFAHAEHLPAKWIPVRSPSDIAIAVSTGTGLAVTGANPVLMESGFALFLFTWSHFLTANRYPLRLKMLVGGDSLTMPGYEANCEYLNIIILLSDSPNTRDRWDVNGSSVLSVVDSRMDDLNGSGTCANINNCRIKDKPIVVAIRN